nr:hypothetical protein [Bradyrhizobium brasilense]
MPSDLERVNAAAAKQAAQTRFTALLHHIDEDALLPGVSTTKAAGQRGGNGITVAKCEEGLTDKIRDLCARAYTGRYRPQPVRRVYIPKVGGGKRPLGVPALEDKIVQSTVAEVLSAVYETDSRRRALLSTRTLTIRAPCNWFSDAAGTI